MKIKNILIALGVASAGLMTSSCVNDLDLEPVDPSTTNSSTFGDDPEAYMDRVLAEVYASFVVHGPNNNAQVSDFDGGMSTFTRAIYNLEEIPTDESSWFSTGDAALYTLTFGNIAADNAGVFGTYSRLIINVALCNNFIQCVERGDFKLPAEKAEKGKDAIRQAKILRSLCYYYLIDLFGDVPYADENDPIGAVAPQLSRAEVFNYATKTLEDVIAEYGAAPQIPAYGYCGKEFGQGVLMRFYLNAEVFTGTPRWNDCLRVANDIIAAHKGTGFQGSGLTEHFVQNFGANNKDFALGGAGNAHEILFMLPANTPNILSYGSSTMMILAFIDGSEQEFYGVGNGWKCAKPRPQFVNKFEWDNANQETSPDTRTMFWKTSKDGYANAMPNTAQSQWQANGYETPKFINRYINADGTLGDAAPAQGDGNVTTAYPMMRLSEVYLTAAEAILHGAGSQSDALTYVNYVRERAGVAPWSATQLTLNSLQDERCRELYLENCRRTDLIRYGKFVSGYNWNWKGNTENGTDLKEHNKLYPIPAQIINQTSYKQNPGY